MDEALQALASHLESGEQEPPALDDARREFLNKMSHDLRNQLNSVLGWILLLGDSEEMTTPEELQDCASQIREEGMRMHALAENMQAVFPDRGCWV